LGDNRIIIARILWLFSIWG